VSWTDSRTKYFLFHAKASSDSKGVSLRDAKMEYLLATSGVKANKNLKDFWVLILKESIPIK
jgi:hypothetical protein